MKLIPPVKVTDATLVSSSVPENDYPAWSAGTTYAVGARVIEAHRIYESTIAGNTGHDPSGGGTEWLDIGPTNRWAMFDQAAGPRTTAAAPIVVTIAPVAPVDTLGLIDVTAASVRVQVSIGGNPHYDQTRDDGAFAPAFLGLPAQPGQSITVTITPSPGTSAAVGKLVIGDAFDLGVTETGPTVSLTDFSRRETDDFGQTTIVERAWARRVTLRTRLDSSVVDEVQRRVTAVRAVPALWIGDEGFESLTAYGFYKGFSADVQLGAVTLCSLTIEGLPNADTGGSLSDPSPDRPSDLLVIRPEPVTDAVLVSSNVIENDYPQWSNVTSYVMGARVLRGSLHRIFESAIANNLGNDPAAGGTQWLDAGPTNRWAMFDQALGSVTTATGQIVVALEPGVPVSALAVIDTDAASVRVQASGYDQTKETVVDGVRSTTLTFLDLDVPAGATVTVTISAASGSDAVSVGTLLIGTLERLGITENSPTIGINDFSRKEADDFGNILPVQRGWAKRLTARSLVSTSAVESMLRRIAALRAKPALWIGSDGFDSLTVYGFYKDFSVEVAVPVSICAFSIEGLTTAPPGPPGVPVPGETAWTIAGNGISSGGVTLPALVVTGAIDATTAEAIIFEYRPFVSGQASDVNWRAAGVEATNCQRKEITSVSPATAYEVAVSYMVGVNAGVRRILGPVTTASGYAAIIEGSVDGNPPWHRPPQLGDEYLRISNDGGLTFGAPFKVAGENGSDGTNGINGQYQQYAFRRSATQPPTPTGGGLPAGWSDGIPTGADPLWMTVSTQRDGALIVGASWSTPVRIDAPTVLVQWSQTSSGPWHAGFAAGDLYMRQSSDGGATWSTPARVVGEDGSDGSNGVDGKFTSFIFIRAASQPSAPASGSGNPPPAWSDAPPTGTNPLWYSRADFRNGVQLSNWSTPVRLDAPPVLTQWSVSSGGPWHSNFTAGDLYMRQSSDAGVSWSTPARVVGEDGSDGTNGTNGKFVSFVFVRQTNQPSTPATGSGNPPSGWFDAPPSGTNPLWCSTAEFRDGAQLDAWSTPIRLDAPAVLTQWSTTSSGPWHSNFTAGDLYMRQSNDGGLTWGTSARVVGENGGAGSNGTNGKFMSFVFVRQPNQPSTPATGSGNPPSGWFDAPPTGTNPLWCSTADFRDGVQLDAWSTPIRLDAPAVLVQWSADGSNWHSNFTTGDLYQRQSLDGGATWGAAVRVVGEDGSNGSNGTNGSYTSFVFRRAASPPGTPGTGTGDPPPGWSDAPPAGTDPLYQTSADFRDGAQLTAWAAPVRLDGVSPIALELSVYAMDVAADANNVTKAGALPKGSVVSLTQAGVALTPSSVNFTYSDGGAGAFAADYGVIANTVRLTTANAPGWVDVNVVYAGLTYTKRIAISRTQDPQAPPSQTSAYTGVVGGSGSGSTTYDGSGILSPELVLKANGSGQIIASASGEYYTDTPPASVRTLTVAMRVEIAPLSTGVWSAPLSENIGTQAFWDKTDATPGLVNTGGTFTGLTAGADYRIRVNTRKVSGSNPSVNIDNGGLSVSQ